MPWPFTFGTASSPVAASNLDLMFNTAASGTAIPCSALGTNAISLTPLPTFPALTAYTELCGYRFRAATSSTGTVTLQYNGLGLLNVYHADGVTQVSTGDMVAGFEYVARFSLSLNSGAGGFFLESPALPTAASTWLTPGGRLSNVSGTPVVFTSQGSNAVYYAPYIHPFCPIYNGTSMQTVQFTSSLSDAVGLQLNMGGSPATWPQNTVFDIFMTLVGGVPTLCTISWASLTTRNVTLAVWGGVLTNNSANTAQTTAGPITLPVHQGTFLGSFMTHPSINGNVQWIFGSAASGGGNALLQISNYYNRVLFNTIVQDNGANYTYTGGIRQARASNTNQIAFLQTDSERSSLFVNTTQNNMLAAAATSTVITGIGFDSTAAFQNFTQTWNTSSTNGAIFSAVTTMGFITTGYHIATALEQGDGTNANIFNRVSTNFLQGLIWL